MLSLSLYVGMLETNEDRDKLEYIYTNYKKIMTAIAYEKVGKYQAEEDVVHNAILKLIKYLDRIDIEKNETMILVKVITNSCALDWLKHKFPKSFTQTYLEDIPVDIEDEYTLPPASQIISEEGFDEIVRCIRSINNTNRDACELRFLFGMNEKEIADILNITPKNVGVRITRGRKEIINKLKEAGYNVEKSKK